MRMPRSTWLGLAWLFLAAQAGTVAAQSADTAQPESADAQTADPASVAPPPAADDAQELVKQLSNPIASLISVPLQNNYDWGMGPDDDGYWLDQIVSRRPYTFGAALERARALCG